MRKNIEFYSENCLLKGHLYLPENFEEKIPCIVMCHGFAGVKEMLLPSFAEKFSLNGYSVITFDYRGFGESEGIRGLLSAWNQIKDIRNAITFASSLEEIDNTKLGIWGSSYGGAHAVTLAGIEKRVKCVCLQLPFGNGERLVLGNKTTEEKAKLLDSLNKMWIKTVTKNKALEMPINKFLSDSDSINFYSKYVKEFPQMDVKIPYITMMETIEYKPEDFLINSDVPMHITGAINDILNPVSEAESIYTKAKGPKELLKINASHFEVYDGENFELVSTAQLSWFNKYLRL